MSDVLRVITDDLGPVLWLALVVGLVVLTVAIHERRTRSDVRWWEREEAEERAAQAALYPVGDRTTPIRRVAR